MSTFICLFQMEPSGLHGVYTHVNTHTYTHTRTYTHTHIAFALWELLNNDILMLFIYRDCLPGPLDASDSHVVPLNFSLKLSSVIHLL